MTSLPHTVSESGCWLFSGSISPQGYGQLRDPERRGRNVTAHRKAWELVHGPIPAGLMVDHSCRNRRCINVDHLRLATPSQNAAHTPKRADSLSAYKGVRRHGRSWQASLAHVHLGTFDSPVAAALAYDAAARERYGEFAWTNFELVDAGAAVAA